jgi:hypothetical protein
MTVSIQNAAQALLSKIQAPAGVVNTLATKDGRGEIIRVMIDSEYWRALKPGIPEMFSGYRVDVVKREKSFAFH